MRIVHSLDTTSLFLLGVTITGLTIATTIGVLAGLTTVIYNLIRIYKELKQKKNG